METLLEHPVVKRALDKGARAAPAPPAPLETRRLRELCLECGADDAGFVEIGRASLAAERERILAVFPAARSLVSLVVRTNREPIRSPARSVANLEFHRAAHRLDEAAGRIVAALEAQGVPALNPAMGFPMEMDDFPERGWVVSHKLVAEAAGMGRMGIHRSVIHPRFGSFVLLGTVVVGTEIDAYDRPLDVNPCVECKLCVAACPVGAIEPDGRFDFGACYTHNYREFMGGFADWVETVADSGSAREYRRRVHGSETVSMWQSLSFGANYKSAYCVAVCPAGEELIGPYLRDKKAHREAVVRPLQEKREPLYVLPGSDAEAHAARRFPHKTLRRVGSGTRPRDVRGFLRGLPLAFQRGRSKGVNAVFHFTFTGGEEVKATVEIRDGSLKVSEGHAGTADLRVVADARTWLGIVAKERSVPWALLTRRLRLRGDPRLLRSFGRCFAV